MGDVGRAKDYLSCSKDGIELGRAAHTATVARWEGSKGKTRRCIRRVLLSTNVLWARLNGAELMEPFGEINIFLPIHPNPDLYWRGHC